MSHEAQSGDKDNTEQVSREAIDKLIALWPAKPQEVAKKVIEKYGPPSEATPTHLGWYGNGP
jgi:hypothetical protein